MLNISIFLPNKPGVFATFLDVLIKNKIEIRAVTVAENDEYGLLLLLVDKPMECINILEEKGYDVSVTDVIAVKMRSRENTKGLQEIAKVLGDNNVNIEYLYSTMIKNESLLIIRVNDNERAKEVLKNNSFDLEERQAI